MSQSNEPPLALDSWRVKVKLNDGDDFDLYPEDFSETTRNNIIETVSTYTDNYIDHLKGKYAGEVSDAVESKPKFNSWYQRPDGSLVPLVEAPEAEDLHAQNSKRFVDYEKK